MNKYFLYMPHHDIYLNLCHQKEHLFSVFFQFGLIWPFFPTFKKLHFFIWFCFIIIVLFIIICISFIFLFIMLRFSYVLTGFVFMRRRQRHFNPILVTEIS